MSTKAQRKRCEDKYGKLARRFRTLIDYCSMRDMEQIAGILKDTASDMALKLSKRDKDFEACKWGWIASATGC